MKIKKSTFSSNNHLCIILKFIKIDYAVDTLMLFVELSIKCLRKNIIVVVKLYDIDLAPSGN